MIAPRIVEIGPRDRPVRLANHLPISLIAGPCQMESRAHALETAQALKEIAARRGIGLIYKTSFDKANRTSGKAARGMGLKAALPVFAEIRDSLGLPTLTDVHESEQCAPVAAKITDAGNPNVVLTERGASFGYNTLVSDMRALPIMARTGHPVVFDATHSVQQPGGQGASSGGQREFVETLARAAVAVGVAGLFIETHPDPDHAPSDGPNMVPLKDFEALVTRLQAIDSLVKGFAPSDGRSAEGREGLNRPAH